MDTTLVLVMLVVSGVIAIFNRGTIIALAVSYQMVRNNDEVLARTLAPQVLAGKGEQGTLKEALLLIKGKSSDE